MLFQFINQLLHQAFTPEKEVLVLRPEWKRPSEWAAVIVIQRLLAQGQGAKGQVQGLAAQLVDRSQGLLVLARRFSGLSWATCTPNDLWMSEALRTKLSNRIGAALLDQGTGCFQAIADLTFGQGTIDGIAEQGFRHLTG